MSTRELAQFFAEGMADGTFARLPRLTPAATPEFAQQCLLVYYRLRDAAEDERQEFSDTWTLRERIAAPSVVAEIEAAISDARAWLSRVSRRGGRGLPPPAAEPAGAGRSPADKGHGCPALSPAVGPAPMPSGAAQPLYIIHPGDPLFCASGVQGLPGDFPATNLDPDREKTQP